MAGDNNADLDKLYLGRAGEYLVAAHLLRHGFNASPLPVDIGVDLLAYRELNTSVPLIQAEHQLYQFQIKTTTTGEYRASLPAGKVQELWMKAINLVVVFWANGTTPEVLMLPPSLVRMLTSGGFQDPIAPFVMTGEFVSLRFILEDGRCFIRNLDHDVTAMLGRFDRIEPADIDTGMFPPYAVWAADGKALVAFDPD